MTDTPCPCGSGTPYDHCCAPLLTGTPAPTAEALMRSRYTAFTRADIDYLLSTMAPEIRADLDPVETRQVATDSEWLGLDIRAASGGGPDESEGTVEYVATFRLNGQKRIHHERATFNRSGAGHWQVCGGEVSPKGDPVQVDKVGRNDPCPCQSGKKYKKCCGA